MINFWKSWDKESKRVYLSGLTLFALAVFFFYCYYFWGNDAVIQWRTIGETEKVHTAIDTFSKGIFDFTVETDAYIIFERFIGSDITINVTASYIYFFLLVIALVLALTTLTFLNNWFYFLGTSVIMSYFIFQQPDVLFSGFKFNKLIQIMPVVFLGGTSYLFYAFGKPANFLYRFLIFLGINFIYYFIIHLYAYTSYSELYLLNYGGLAAICISLLFIFFVSFEVVYSFLYLISGNNKVGNQNGTLHFTIIFILYMLNLVLQYFHLSRQFHLNIFYISPFIVFTASSVLGIWGFRERSVMFPKLLPFFPFGAVLYVCWAIVSFSTIGFYFASGNDPVTEVFEDVILFTHIGFGIGFFMYVLMNYQRWFNGEVRVHRLIYSYQGYSFLFVWATGIMIVLSLFFYSNMFTYRQAIAGYYNGLGDAYFQDKDYVLAEDYYKQAASYEFQNHKTNYSLATIYKNTQQLTEAMNFYRKANLKKPSPYAYANMVGLQLNQGKNLEAILDLKEGLAEFPGSGELLNNMGLLYEKISFPDSAIIYFNLSEKLTGRKSVVLTNKLALLTKENIQLKEDFENESTAEYLPLKINRLAFNTVNRKQSQDSLNFTKLQILNAENFSLINNYFFNKLHSIDTTQINRIEHLAQIDTNLSYKSDLEYIKACANFYNGQPAKAMKSVDNLQLSDQYIAGNYLNTLGLWALKKNIPRFAADIFQMASDKGNKTALVNKAVALSEAGEKQKALMLWNTDAIAKDKDLQIIADKMINLLGVNDINMILVGEDAIKYAFLHYRLQELSDEQRGNLFFSFKDKGYQFKAGADLFNFYFDNSNKDRCSEILEVIKNLTTSVQDKKFLNVLIFKNLILQNDWDAIERGLGELTLNKEDESYRYYLKALVSENQNNDKAAADNYRIAFQTMPFDERVILSSAGFFGKRLKDHQTAFNILLESVALNPYSAALYEAYCIESIHYGIPAFAESGLQNLRPLITDMEYREFLKIFESEKVAFNKHIFGN